MATSKDYIDVDVETARIKRIISNTQSKRHRASYQSILAFAQRENPDLEMEAIKYLINDMIDNKIIYNMNKNNPEKESFKIFGKLDDQGETATQTDFEFRNSHEGITAETITESFLDDKIKLEVKKYINDSLICTLGDIIKAEINQKFAECTSNHNVKECGRCDNNLLLTATLNDHIAFLQKQLEAKDDIIKMVMNEKNEVKKYNKDSQGERKPGFVNKTNDDKRTQHINPSDEYNSNMNTSRQETTSTNTNTIDKDVHKHDDFQNQRKKSRSTRTVTIVGDSMVSNVKAYELNELLPKKTRAFVRPHSSAIVKDMHDYVNPTRKYKPDLYILHAGTNDLRSGKGPEKIANEIIDLAKSVKTDENEVLISAIIHRNDYLNEKGKKVNDQLKLKIRGQNISLLEHNNISNLHLNSSNLHLNKDGVDLLKQNFANYIKL